jgi:exopolyphosphatase / guanosine-5'-triphosphate,3'-diphosphate pyrophosphatase
MSPRRSAFIDIGTNTILCVIAEIRDTGRFRVLEDLAEITRLGQDVDRTRHISAAGEERSLAVLRRYREVCDYLGVEQIVAVGTSALRDANNSAAVCARFREQLGCDVRVISGEQEAAYSFLAVQRGLCLNGQEIFVIDIGGGSTELIRGNAAGTCLVTSLDLGSVRLTERFLHSDPVQPEEVACMRDAIDGDLELLAQSGMQPDPALVLVGIAGTFTTLAAMEKRLARDSHREVHGSWLSRDAVTRQVCSLGEKSIAERREMIGLDPERADVIFAGAYLVERIMKRYESERLIVSDQGVRYGLLHEAAQPL